MGLILENFTTVDDIDDEPIEEGEQPVIAATEGEACAAVSAVDIQETAASRKGATTQHPSSSPIKASGYYVEFPTAPIPASLLVAPVVTPVVVISPPSPSPHSDNLHHFAVVNEGGATGANGTDDKVLEEVTDSSKDEEAIALNETTDPSAIIINRHSPPPPQCASAVSTHHNDETDIDGAYSSAPQTTATENHHHGLEEILAVSHTDEEAAAKSTGAVLGVNEEEQI